MKIIGYEIKKGHFNGKDWSKAYIYTTSAISSNDYQSSFGYSCELLKVSIDVWHDFIKNFESIEDVIDSVIIPYYDKYGRICSLSI